MTAINSRLTKRLNFNSKIIWLAIVFLTAVIAGISITDEKWIYFGVILSPFVIYICIEKPFIFPFGLYVLLLPFDSVLAVVSSTEGATLTKFLGMLTILVLSLKGLFEKKFKKPGTTSILWSLFILYSFITFWWAIEPQKVMSRLPTAIGLFLLYLVVANIYIRRNEFETIKWCILVGGLATSILTIYAYKASGIRETISFGNRSAEANYSAYSLLFSISISIGTMMKQKSRVRKLLFGVVVFFIVFAVLVTGSRGGMLGVATIIIVYILYSKQKITIGTIAIVLGIAVIPFIPDFFFERWGKAVETGGAGRLDIWYVGCIALKKYWINGAGLSNFNYAYTEFENYAPTFQGTHRASHNLYLGIFVQLGLVGMTLMILAIWKHYKAIQTRVAIYDNETVMLKASFWGILLSSFFLDPVWRKDFWLLWIVIMMRNNILIK